MTQIAPATPATETQKTDKAPTTANVKRMRSLDRLAEIANNMANPVEVRHAATARAKHVAMVQTRRDMTQHEAQVKRAISLVRRETRKRVDAAIFGAFECESGDVESLLAALDAEIK